MITVGVRELKNNLSYYLRGVKKGQTRDHNGTGTICCGIDAGRGFYERVTRPRTQPKRHRHMERRQAQRRLPFGGR